MPKTVTSPWEPEKLRQSAMFRPLLPFVEHYLEFSDWPSVKQLNTALFEQRAPVHSIEGVRIKLVDQDPRPEKLEDQYAPRIALRGEIQTREHNWHDFFQAVTWAMFPETKVAINALHYPAAKARFNDPGFKGKRTQQENALSQFDECGIVILSSNTALLEAIRNFEWQELFWHQRQSLSQDMKCIVFGHAIYEKAITPYIGLTAKAILIEVDSNTLSLDDAAFLSHCDALLAQRFTAPVEINSPRMLQPFPVLGLPGYFEGNEDEAFYDNREYFRPRPTKQADKSM